MRNQRRQYSCAWAGSFEISTRRSSAVDEKASKGRA